jgi:hypothetical protein
VEVVQPSKNMVAAPYTFGVLLLSGPKRGSVKLYAAPPS